MANVTNVRVELRQTRHDSPYDRDRAFKIMLALFKKKVADSGVLTEYKNHESYESPARKARHKLRETISSRKLDEIEGKLRRGEQVTKDKNLVKKVQTRMKKKKFRKDKYRAEGGYNRDNGGGGGFNLSYRDADN